MQISIIDTGYVNSSRTGSQLGTALRANSGSAITLKTSSVRGRGGANTDNSPIPSSYAQTVTNFASFENDQYTVSFVLNEKTSGDYLLVRQLIRLKETRGLKLLYVSAITDTKKGLVELAGAKNTGTSAFSGNEVGSTIPHLIGRVKDWNIDDSSDTGFLKGSFTFEETA